MSTPPLLLNLILLRPRLQRVTGTVDLNRTTLPPSSVTLLKTSRPGQRRYLLPDERDLRSRVVGIGESPVGHVQAGEFARRVVLATT